MAIFECTGGISPTGNARPSDVKLGVSFSNENDIDQVGTFAAQEKTIVSSRLDQIVIPDDGYYLSSVTVEGLEPTGTFKPTSRAANIDMGEESNYRYVNTESVPNNNTGTYTFGSGSTGGTVDLGVTNTYRYVNAGNVYNKGYGDGQSVGYSQGVASLTLPNTLTIYHYCNDVIDIVSLPMALVSQYSQFSMASGGPNGYGSASSLMFNASSTPVTGSGLTEVAANSRYWLDKNQAWISFRADKNPGPAGFSVTFYK